MKHTLHLGMFDMDYLRFGTGRGALVIIPGLSLTPLCPLESAIVSAYSAFTRDYTVFFFDRRTNPPEGYSTFDMAEDTFKALTTLDVDRFDVMGLSHGGMIALSLALNHPDNIRSLILGCTASRPNPVTRQAIGGWIELAKAGDARALNENMIERVFSVEFAAQLKPALLASTPDVDFNEFITLAAPIITFDVYDRLNEIKAPALVLGSWGDRVLSAEASVEIAQKLGCDLRMFDSRTGHGVYDETPEFIAHAAKFLQA